MKADPHFLTTHEASKGLQDTLNPHSTGVLQTQEGNGGGVKKNVYLDKSFPVAPVAGLHVIRIKLGERRTLSRIRLRQPGEENQDRTIINMSGQLHIGATGPV